MDTDPFTIQDAGVAEFVGETSKLTVPVDVPPTPIVVDIDTE